MQLRKFRINQKPCLAVEHEGQFVDLTKLLTPEEIETDLIDVLGNWSQWQPKIKTQLQEKQDLPIVPKNAEPLLPFQPLSLRDFMLSEQHAMQAARGFVREFMPKLLPVVNGYEKLTGKTFPAFKLKPIWYRQPVYYMSNHLNLVTEGEDIPWPAYTHYLDYELEVAWVIVKSLRNATHQEALDAIGGFMVLNDVSARDVQLEEMRSGFGPQKAKHFVNGLSITVATADEVLPFINELKAEVRINGETKVTTSTAGMQHSIADVLVHVSQDETLHPGEVFCTGTLPDGCAMETGYWVKSGDTLELWVEKVGSLKNKIGQRVDS